MASCLWSHRFAVLLSVFLLISPARPIQLWTAPAALPSVIPASCRAALSTNITCSPRLLGASEVEAQSDPGNVFLQQYCTSACQASLLVNISLVVETQLLQYLLNLPPVFSVWCTFPVWNHFLRVFQPHKSIWKCDS
jgi:hypothetical protein